MTVMTLPSPVRTLFCALRASLKAALVGCLWVAASLAIAAPGDGAAVARASDWLGSIVVAPNGEEIGTIRDLAIDDSGKVAYIVVSVGSFLIENNLIAVRVDALTDAGDHRFVLDADIGTLRGAERFAVDRPWPARADVVRADPPTMSAPKTVQPSSEDAVADAQPPDSGTATISTGTKTAYLSADERYIKRVDPPPAPLSPPVSEAPRPAATVTSSSGPKTRFDRLDRDGDGVLNRSEVALEMGPKDKYSKIDVNANGVIEHDEFETLRAQHERNP